jgi:hypothetical protein
MTPSRIEPATCRFVECCELGIYFYLWLFYTEFRWCCLVLEDRVRQRRRCIKHTESLHYNDYRRPSLLRGKLGFVRSPCCLRVYLFSHFQLFSWVTLFFHKTSFEKYAIDCHSNYFLISQT